MKYFLMLLYSTLLSASGGTILNIPPDSVENDVSLCGTVDGVDYNIVSGGYTIIYPDSNQWPIKAENIYKDGRSIDWSTKPVFLVNEEPILEDVKRIVSRAVWNEPGIIPAQFYSNIHRENIIITIRINPDTGNVTDVEFYIRSDLFKPELFPVSLFHSMAEPIKKLKYNVTRQGKELNFVFLVYTYRFDYDKPERL